MRQAHPCEHNIISKHSTSQQKIISPKNDVENAGVDATVEEVDPSLGNARKLVSLTIRLVSAALRMFWILIDHCSTIDHLRGSE